MDPLSRVQYTLLKRFFPADPNRLTGSAYNGRSKLKVLLGDDIFNKLQGKTVVDFGCGRGSTSVEIAQNGARFVIGLDVRASVLDAARGKALAAGVADRVNFLTPAQARGALADAVISLDAFEHFDNPAGVLVEIYRLLKPGGVLLASFGPIWGHPWGGHAFAPFPWAHLVLRERALCEWFTDVKGTPVKRFRDVSGGLNKMTLGKFVALVRSSPFQSARIVTVPIRRLQPLHNRLTREFLTATVRCELRKHESHESVHVPSDP